MTHYEFGAANNEDKEAKSIPEYQFGLLKKTLLSFISILKENPDEKLEFIINDIDDGIELANHYCQGFLKKQDETIQNRITIRVEKNDYFSLLKEEKNKSIDSIHIKNPNIQFSSLTMSGYKSIEDIVNKTKHGLVLTTSISPRAIAEWKEKAFAHAKEGQLQCKYIRLPYTTYWINRDGEQPFSYGSQLLITNNSIHCTDELPITVRPNSEGEPSCDEENLKKNSGNKWHYQPPGF